MRILKGKKKKTRSNEKPKLEMKQKRKKSRWEVMKEAEKKGNMLEEIEERKKRSGNG